MLIPMTRRGSFIVGGSDSINLHVVGGTERPVNPQENTIWINTSQEIANWSINAEEPTSPENGTVWIEMGMSGRVKFNALRENELNVRLFTARQYSNDVWSKVPAELYQNEQWQGIISREYLFNNGNTVPWTAYSQKGGCNIGSTTINFTSVVDYRGAWTTNKIDLTDYSKIVAVGNVTSVLNPDYNNIPRLMIVNSPITETSQYGPVYKTFTSTGQITVELDISKVIGSYHVEICGSCVGSFYQVYLEG